MNRTNSLLLLAALIFWVGPVISGAPPGAGAEPRDPQEFFDESFNDLPQELELAREEGKAGILIMFEMDECPFCHRMKQTALNRSDVQDYFHRHFRILSVDIEGDLELIDFAGNTTTQKEFSLKQHRVRATPVLRFFDLQGQPMKNGRFTGATRDARELMLLGRFIVEGYNDKESFYRFKREQARPTPNG